MSRPSARQLLTPAELAKIPARLMWTVDGKPQGPVPARLEFLGRAGAVLVVENPPLPPARSFARVAVGGPRPLHVFSGWVWDVRTSGPGPSRVNMSDDHPMSPVAFKKLAEALTKAT